MSKARSVRYTVIMAIDVYDTWEINTLPVDHEVALKTEVWASITLHPTSVASEVNKSWNKMKLMFMCLQALDVNGWWVSYTFSAYAEVTNITMVKLVM
ncbi:hypothetical protein F2Q70_00029136 [Brassica cretica]|uniref:Uncharacterized protein n=1 Tax=Brassica cretica TaxID=69181 RepID=A0A8S9FN35_BRACR|nr:hypothetical protein F2Q70_00029136 [Brassica cretica]